MAKVLIAEDDPLEREILESVIEEMGHVPLLSPNGMHALATLECDRKIALLLTDMAMPEMDGRALIQAARQLPAHTRLPIVIMSGVVAPKEIADILLHGAEAFLSKPVRLQELRHYVAAALDRR